MSDELPLSGFVIGGFRSFYGEPQRARLGRITLIAGPNNAGKSNVLAAVRAILANPLGPLKLEALDSPITNDTNELKPLVYGMGVPVGPGDRMQVLDGVLTAAQRGGNVWRIFADAVVVDDMIWFEREQPQAGTSKPVWRPALIDRAIQAFQQRGIAVEALNVLTGPWRVAFEGPKETYLGRAIANVLDKIAAERVHGVPTQLIPAVRSIVAVGSPDNQLKEPNGRGLPDLLVALQSPAASTLREDSRKFTAINAFLQALLEDSDAQIVVPYTRDNVYFQKDGRVLPLAQLGAGLSQLIMIATVATWYDKHVVCIEEPEMNLHPTLLRRLICYLRDSTTNQYIIASHSANLLDDPSISIVRAGYESSEGTTLTTVLTAGDRADISYELGYRPSDILHANAIIWVEGPSDAIYLRKWISLTDGTLIEGADYSLMWYGGAAYADLTANDIIDEDVDTVKIFASVLNINRHMVLVMDSDRASRRSKINKNKTRLIEEFRQHGAHVWLTDGREIENYVPRDEFITAATARRRKPVTYPMLDAVDPYEDMFVPLNGTYSKVRIALRLTTDLAEVWDTPKLRERVKALCEFIRTAKHQPIEKGVDAPSELDA